MSYPPFSDEYFMNEALKEAEKAFDEEEVPVGAIITSNNLIIARAYNTTQKLMDVTAHAEMIAITSASNNLTSKYLTDCTIYVTIEPCLMCAGALAWSQIDRIVYGAPDPKSGFMRHGRGVLHPKTEIVPGILENECMDILKRFFLTRRDLRN